MAVEFQMNVAAIEFTGQDVANGGLHVVGDPFDEVRGVLVLDVEHLFVNLLHGHAAAENGRDGQVTMDIVAVLLNEGFGKEG
jgi:hypothetical protein